MFKFQGAQDGHSDNIAVFNLPTTDAGLESLNGLNIVLLDNYFQILRLNLTFLDPQLLTLT